MRTKEKRGKKETYLRNPRFQYRYSSTHAFATALGGSDNIVSFTTSRYSNRPLLVQGSGAGAAVTAMAVVSDLIKVAERRG